VDEVTLCAAVDQLMPPKGGKMAALRRFLDHARLALARGVTIEDLCDCLLEHGIQMSPTQLRARLAGERVPGRPPAIEKIHRATGAVSGAQSVPKRCRSGA
jgi:hypothetical protein